MTGKTSAFLAVQLIVSSESVSFLYGFTALWTLAAFPHS
jgi:hypothetical protein